MYMLLVHINVCISAKTDLSVKGTLRMLTSVNLPVIAYLMIIALCFRRCLLCSQNHSFDHDVSAEWRVQINKSCVCLRFVLLNRETANIGLVSSVGRARVRQSGGRSFKSCSRKFVFVHPKFIKKFTQLVSLVVYSMISYYLHEMFNMQAREHFVCAFSSSFWWIHINSCLFRDAGKLKLYK